LQCSIACLYTAECDHQGVTAEFSEASSRLRLFSDENGCRKSPFLVDRRELCQYRVGARGHRDCTYSACYFSYDVAAVRHRTDNTDQAWSERLWKAPLRTELAKLASQSELAVDPPLSGGFAAVGSDSRPDASLSLVPLETPRPLLFPSRRLALSCSPRYSPRRLCVTRWPRRRVPPLPALRGFFSL